MNKLIILFAFGTLLSSCGNTIKNNDASVEVESGTEVQEVITETAQKIEPSPKKIEDPHGLLGFWVGYFEDATEEYNEITVDEAFWWNRDNKINISIDEIDGEKVKGHSVVAGNDRPFEGSIQKIEKEGGSIAHTFEVREPGDDKYDGSFTFEIENGELTGKWTAYKDIDIKHRKYTHDGEIEEFITREFATASNKIYKINASNTPLKKQDVENLKKGDLTIIRNMIYARHGYSFKKRPLRVFFDAQPWYIPVHADIRSEFTELEKKNIQLLLSFEENAAEYYDYFGRG